MREIIKTEYVRLVLFSVLGFLFFNIKTQNKIFPYIYKILNIDNLIVYRSFRNFLLFGFVLIVYFFTWKVLKKKQKSFTIYKILYSVLSAVSTLFFIGYLILSKSAVY